MSVRQLEPVVPVVTPGREPALVAAAEYSEFCHVHQDCCGRTLCDGDFHVQPECRAWVDHRGGRCSECGLPWCPECLRIDAAMELGHLAVGFYACPYCGQVDQ